ncbi:RabGAP/TBC [Basidiobolus meristosporus CBS 931.73]|uniref:GTPase-activating protein GYP7 n=1 Tax=Basidiobolus meristosporus CBS 931.73 TaxID=1314790 RepID=A0A1Y1YP26_9FUNG|nr:RabGAP/TBC [Basidiobolus meristosporus CBS 931.73]|eukprot:ORX99752.1 RabGAP/TBC [Basidiobolus meristosporus CBS 931.73]
MSHPNPNDVDWDVLQLSEVPDDMKDILRTGLLFCKTNVQVYRSGSPDDKIKGYLCIVEEETGVYALLWIPERLIPTKHQEIYKMVENNPQIKVLGIEGKTIIKPEIYVPSPKLYADDSNTVFDAFYWINLREIDSILSQPPSVTEWHGSIIILLRSGEPLPPLWFHNDQANVQLWGGDEFLAWLCQIGNLTESKTEPNLFYLNKQSEQESRAPLNGEQTESKNSSPRPTAAQIFNEGFNRGLGLFDPNNRDSLVNAAQELKWSVLEKFSKVTQFTKHSAAQILEHPLGRPLVPFLPPEFVEVVEASPAAQDVMQEYEVAKLYLAKWANGVVQKAKRHRRQEPDVEYHVDEDFLEETDLGTFEVLSDFSYDSKESLRTSPITSELWYIYFEGSAGESSEGRLLMREEDIKSSVFAGGVENKIRPIVWKYLLGVYPWDSTEAQRKEIRERNKTEYERLKGLWFGQKELEEDTSFRDQKHQIEKDVLRTDRTNPLFLEEEVSNEGGLDALSATGLPGTNSNLEMLKHILITYNFYNRDLGYVQGMSDLLAPLFVVMQDEVETFWCFVNFMERMKVNFYTDQSGMNRQLRTLEALIRFMDPPMSRHLEQTDSSNLFFCFRWLLIWFKREFEYENVMRLWEVLWTDHISKDFHLFIALAIINQNRRVILEELTAFDEILKWANDQSMHIDLETTLCRAEVLYRHFCQRVEAADRVASQSSTDTSIRDPVPLALREIIKKSKPHHD